MYRTSRLLGVLTLLLAMSQAAFADSFTFQGGLTSSGVPVDDACDFRFSLWDAASGGTQIGSSLSRLNVAVTEGQFSVVLDFGDDAFAETGRWISIDVRCPAGSGSYTTLTPRQPITPTPQAHALAAASTSVGNIPAAATVRFENDSSSSSSIGAHGVITASSAGGFSTGVRGENRSTTGSGIGVWGSQNGSGWGVYGTTPSGIGVYGNATGTSGVNYGLYGRSGSPDGYGVYASHSASTGVTPAVYGETRSTFNRAIAMHGVVNTTASGQDSIGVRGYNRGTSTRGIGVEGRHDGSGWGVFGTAPAGRGVYGTTNSGVGVYGNSLTGTGVVGTASGSSAVAVEAHGGGNAVALYAHTDSSAWAAFLDGRVVMTDAVYMSNVPFGDYANLQWDPNTFQIFYDNSSRRFKENIRPLDDDFVKILDVQPMTYTRPNRPDRWEIGFIAEEMHEAGLAPLVEYDEDGAPHGVRYDKIPLYLVGVLQDERRRAQSLEQRVHDQDQTIKELEERLANLEALVAQLAQD